MECTFLFLLAHEQSLRTVTIGANETRQKSTDFRT